MSIPYFAPVTPRPFCGRIICRNGTIEYDGKEGEPTRLVVMTSFEAARVLIQTISATLSPPEAKPTPKRKRRGRR